MKIYALMANDNWYKTTRPIGFFTTREKAVNYYQELEKEEGYWPHSSFFILEYELNDIYKAHREPKERDFLGG